jgi:hypothetical protein
VNTRQKMAKLAILGLTCVVDLARAGVDSLKELVDLLVGHLLAEVCEDVLELTDTDETCHILVENLEAAAVLFWLAGIAEATGAVQDALEGLEVDCAECQHVVALAVSHGNGEYSHSPPTFFSRSWISARVGF